jgi:biotin synthase-like enzyme
VSRDAAGSDTIRHDWIAAEIEAIYTLPLPELIFQAQLAHRAHHRPAELQGCMLLSVKNGGKIAPIARSRRTTAPMSSEPIF